MTVSLDKAVHPTRDQERDLIVGLARTIAPINDYDTQLENDEAAVFVLLVRAARLYAGSLEPGATVRWIDLDTTLLAIRENLEMETPRPRRPVSPMSPFSDRIATRVDTQL